MRVCNICGTPIQEGQEFCGKCGERVIFDNAPDNITIVPDPQTPEQPKDYDFENTNSGSRGSGGSFNNLNNKKKKSKKPLIIAIIIIALLVVSVIAYMAVAFMRQGEVSKKCDELQTYLDKGVKLNETNQSTYETAKDDRSSFNVFQLSQDKSDVDKLIEMSKEYVKANQSYKDLDSAFKSYNETAKKLGVNITECNSYNDANDGVASLKAALDNNNTEQMKELPPSVGEKLDELAKEIDEKGKQQNKENRLNELNREHGTMSSDLDKIYGDANAKGIHKETDIIESYNKVAEALNEMGTAIKEKNLTKAEAKNSEAERKLDSFTKLVRSTPSKKDDSYSEYENVDISDFYVFPDSDTEDLYTLPFENDSDLTVKERYALIIIAINEMYARHGYDFKDLNIAPYFDNRSWYVNEKMGMKKLNKKYFKKGTTEGDNLDYLSSVRDQYKKDYAWAHGTQDDFTSEQYESIAKKYARLRESY